MSCNFPTPTAPNPQEWEDQLKDIIKDACLFSDKFARNMLKGIVKQYKIESITVENVMEDRFYIDDIPAIKPPGIQQSELTVRYFVPTSEEEFEIYEFKTLLQMKRPR